MKKILFCLMSMATMLSAQVRADVQVHNTAGSAVTNVKFGGVDAPEYFADHIFSASRGSSVILEWDAQNLGHRQKTFQITKSYTVITISVSRNGTDAVITSQADDRNLLTVPRRR